MNATDKLWDDLAYARRLNTELEADNARLRRECEGAQHKARQYDDVVGALQVADGGRYRNDTIETVLTRLGECDLLRTLYDELYRVAAESLDPTRTRKERQIALHWLLQKHAALVGAAAAPGGESNRELDAEVARCIFGLEVKYSPPQQFTRDDGSIGDAPEVWWVPGGPLLAYSRDMAAAWEVAEEMRRDHFFLSLDDTLADWSATFRKHGSRKKSTAAAPAASLAICRAALLAKAGAGEGRPDQAEKDPLR